MRILITGGAGFIGRAIVDALVHAGHNVFAFDNLSRNTGDLPNCLLHIGNVLSFSSLDEYMRKVAPEVVIHAAAINGTGSFYTRPHDVAEVVVAGTFNVVRVAALLPQRPLLINLSSSEVYGPRPQVTHNTETDELRPSTGARSSYAVSKLLGEIITDTSALPRVINLRPFNVYGPRMGHDHVIPQLVRKIIQSDGGPLELIGDGSQVRAFLHVGDFARAIVACVDKYGSVTHEIRNTMNVGRPEPVTIAELARLIAKILDFDGRIVAGLARENEVHVRCPNIDRIMNELGWISTIPLHTGLPPVVRHYAMEYSQ